MQVTKDRNLPRAYDLHVVGAYLMVLHKCPVPLIEIERRKLKQMPTQESAQAFLEWKRKQGIDSADESEYRYLLRDLGLVADRELTEVDSVLPLGGDGPPAACLLPAGSRAKVFFLTQDGEALYTQLVSDRPTYESTLFWLILRNQLYLRLIQQVVLDRQSYGASDIRKLIGTKDSTSKNCAVQWLRYFGIARSENGCKLDAETLARRLLGAAILEINKYFERSETYYVKEVDRRLNEAFSLSPSVTDFSAALDTIFHYADKSIMQGYTSGRRDVSLPNHHGISMLKFTGTLPLSIAFQANPAQVLRILRYA